MKKAIIITAVLTLLAGVGGAVWLKTRADAQNAVTAAQEQKQQQPEPSKYDVGPPDPQEMLELVNWERQKAGLSPIAMDDRLNSSAQEKADDLVDRQYWGHVSPEGAQGYELARRNMGDECKMVGENLAVGQTSAEVMNKWMASTDGHREAILSSEYTKIGIAVRENAAVQHFCSPS